MPPPKKITPDLKKYICEGVELIRNSEAFSYKEKVDMLKNVISIGAGAGWKPTEITHEAIRLFKDNNFKKPKGLERAHRYHRRDTLKELIMGDWEGGDWWDWFKDRDYTVLATREENRNESSLDACPREKIPKESNLFEGLQSGYRYGKAEKEFIKETARRLGII
jgi:hypothetical protein